VAALGVFQRAGRSLTCLRLYAYRQAVAVRRGILTGGIKCDDALSVIEN